MSEKRLPRVKYVLVCDDIREEKSNKIILVGLYANKIIVEELPAMMSKLSLRICFDLSQPYLDRFEIGIRRPSGDQVGPFALVVPPAADEFRESSINVNIVPFPLEMAGLYEIISRGEGEEIIIGKFSVEALSVPKDTRLS